MSSKRLLDLAALHAEDRAVEVDVLAAGELLVEARPDLEQAADAAADLGPPGRRRRDPREDLQKRRLAGAVASDDAEHLPLGHLERDVLERPELLAGAMMLLARETLSRHARTSRAACRTPPGTRRGGTSSTAPSTSIATDIRSCPRSVGSDDRKTWRARRRRDARRQRRRPRPGPGRAGSRRARPTASPRSREVIGLNERIHCHFTGIWSTANITPESSGRTWRNTGIM